jgi:hypothetical protein
MLKKIKAMITKSKTIFLFPILISCSLLNGCSILVEDAWYIADDLSGWNRIDITAFHTPQLTATKVYSYQYEANNFKVHLRTSDHSELLSVGPFPIIFPSMSSINDDKLRLDVIYWPCETKEDNIKVTLFLANQNALSPRKEYWKKGENTISCELIYDVSMLKIEEFKVIISSEKCTQSIPTLTFKRKSTLRYGLF